MSEQKANTKKPVSVFLWIAITERHRSYTKPVILKGKTTCGETDQIEYRFLAKDFADAVEIAQKSAINDDAIVDLRRVSHITGGIGHYVTVSTRRRLK